MLAHKYLRTMAVVVLFGHPSTLGTQKSLSVKAYLLLFFGPRDRICLDMQHVCC